MNSTSESLLLRLADADDHHAWSRFLKLYTPLLFFWARKTGLHQADAADLVQDVVAIVFQKLPDFHYQPHKSFRGWLRTITLNKYRDACRKRKLKLVDARQSELVNISGDQGVAETTWDLNYKQALVGSAMELLAREFQPATWAALQDYLMRKQPAAKAAEAAGVSIWTVYAAKSRLMVRLREELEGMLD